MPDFNTTGQNLGAVYLGDGRTRFRVWAPEAQQIEVRLLTPEAQTVPMVRGTRGYWQTTLDGVTPGSLYVYRIDGEKERPDPASRYQPDGVHGPSQVVAPRDFQWTDQDWTGQPLDKWVVYELHTGTFTPEGTFLAAIPYLYGLRDLGVTAVEMMPIAQFPGTRNWGYDGVGLFAVQNSYGTPEDFQKFVDAAHRQGLAVVLDVVYNHLGAEGNYLWDYGPYFTDRYKTPWGSAVNFDGRGSDDVRRFFLENALYWLTDFHCDALRLDAVHAILDFSAGAFLEQLAAAVDRQRACQGRELYLIAESDLNNRRVLWEPAEGGYGLDAQWNDDFHHAVHTLLTGETDGYYQDFALPGGGKTVQYLAKALRENYVYSGQYSRFRGRRHGNSARGIPGRRFVVFNQNHDQIGNRMLGDRLATLVSFDRLKLAAGVLLLAPFVPLLFMGEEYGETNPFQYFVSHTDADLVAAVRKGRREEFEGFLWAGEPPDPADEATFLRSKLCRQDAQSGGQQILYEFYRELIRLRQAVPALANLDAGSTEVETYEQAQVLVMSRRDGANGESQACVIFNFGEEAPNVQVSLPAGLWRTYLDSAARQWQSEDDTQQLSEPLAVAAGYPAPAKARTASRHSAPPAPERIDSDGSVVLRLSPISFLLLVKEREV